MTPTMEARSLRKRFGSAGWRRGRRPTGSSKQLDLEEAGGPPPGRFPVRPADNHVIRSLL